MLQESQVANFQSPFLIFWCKPYQLLFEETVFVRGELLNLLDVLVGRVSRSCWWCIPLSRQLNSNLIATSSFYLKNEKWRKAAVFRFVFCVKVVPLPWFCSFHTAPFCFTTRCRIADITMAENVCTMYSVHGFDQLNMAVLGCSWLYAVHGSILVHFRSPQNGFKCSNKWDWMGFICEC